MRDKVLRYIRKHALLAPGDRVAVACSGGADSVALLRLLLELRGELGLVLSVAHFNHQLRGAEADEDEQFVKALTTRHGLEFHADRGDVAARAAAHRESLETAARALRYGFFDRLLASNEIGKLALAHTMNDQAETVLMRLLRGAGGLGVAAMAAAREVHSLGAESAFSGPSAGPRPRAYVRPLLGTERAEIENYLRALGQSWREDASNQRTAHTRNRVRHELIPELQRDYNPRLIETLAHTAEITRAEEEYWDAELQRILPTLLLPGTPARGGGRSAGASSPEQMIGISAEALRLLPLAIQRRAVRHMAARLGATMDFEHTSAVLDHLLNGSAGSKLEISGDLAARRTYREIVLVRSGQQKPSGDYEYELAVPGECAVPPLKTRFAAKLKPLGQGASGYNRPITRPLPDVVKVRNWRAGDRARLAHSKRERKIKEILQEMHLSGEERRLWPVIESAGKIVWIRSCELEPLTDGAAEIRFDETSDAVKDCP